MDFPGKIEITQTQYAGVVSLSCSAFSSLLGLWYVTFKTVNFAKNLGVGPFNSVVVYCLALTCCWPCVWLWISSHVNSTGDMIYLDALKT
jgi:hypothetical protein